MTKKKTALLFAILILAILFGSMFLAILAFDDIKNYTSPYWFISLNILVGGTIGLFVWKKTKPIFYRIAIKKDKVDNASTFIVSAAIGICFFIFNFLNAEISNLDRCESYEVLGKEYKRGSAYLGPTITALIVDIDGVNERFHCDQDYWNHKQKGDIIKLCKHSSSFGFEYRTLIK